MNKKYEKYWNVIIWVIHGEATPEQMKMVRLWREADPDHERYFLRDRKTEAASLPVVSPSAVRCRKRMDEINAPDTSHTGAFPKDRPIGYGFPI